LPEASNFQGWSMSANLLQENDSQQRKILRPWRPAHLFAADPVLGGPLAEFPIELGQPKAPEPSGPTGQFPSTP